MKSGTRQNEETNRAGWTAAEASRLQNRGSWPARETKPWQCPLLLGPKIKQKTNQREKERLILLRKPKISGIRE
jgi:hypothetical protein